MDKNSGYCTSFGTNANNTNNTMNPNGSSSDVKMLRMNFKTFLKSFDLIACRLYPNEDRNIALSKVLNAFFKLTRSFIVNPILNIVLKRTEYNDKCLP